jgi:hypothetical protein
MEPDGVDVGVGEAPSVDMVIDAASFFDLSNSCQEFSI